MIRRRRIEVHIERHELSIYSNKTAQQATQSPFRDSSSHDSRNSSPVWPRTPSGSISSTTSSTEESALLGDAAIGSARHIAPPRDTDLYCPICGAHEMLLLAEAIAIARLTATALKEGLETGRYHLHCSLSGEWLICIQSLQHDLQQE
jgi:hypothetical protein